MDLLQTIRMPWADLPPETGLCLDRAPLQKRAPTGPGRGARLQVLEQKPLTMACPLWTSRETAEAPLMTWHHQRRQCLQSLSQ